MIDRVTLLAWLAAADPEHVSAYCDLIADGLLALTSEGISRLPPKLPTLPGATA